MEKEGGGATYSVFSLLFLKCHSYIVYATARAKAEKEALRLPSQEPWDKMLADAGIDTADASPELLQQIISKGMEFNAAKAINAGKRENKITSIKKAEEITVIAKRKANAVFGDNPTSEALSKKSKYDTELLPHINIFLVREFFS